MDRKPYLIRPIGEAEFPAFWDVTQAAFNMGDPIVEREVVQPTFEFDRTLAAFDGEQIVGTAGCYSFAMTVPGGPCPVAGVTAVGVLPSHRRRGVLRALMQRQLHDLHESGEAVAALYASEATIYGRYGYGIASRTADLTVRRGEGAYVPDAPADDRLRTRLAAPADARPLLTAVYAALTGDRPGMVPRSAAWWDHALHDPEYRREGLGPRQCVVVEDDTGPRGYALFAMRTNWDAAHLPNGSLTVAELLATDPAAYAAVWRHVLDRDLITTVSVPARPVDDPIQYLLADPRRLRTTVADGLWIRLVTLDRALAQRSYGAPVDVVMEVTDAACPWNAGRWRLAADTGGASCERTGSPADVRLPVTALGAAYLGEPGLAGAVRAGIVTEVRRGAVTAISRALAWDPRPWCPMEF